MPAKGEKPPEAGWTIEEAKGLVARDGLQTHLGEKVQYSPAAGGTWRIFYYDEEGYFGVPKKLYLKVEKSGGNYESTSTYTTSMTGLEIMKAMNPIWRDSKNSESIDLKSEISVCRMYDKEKWEQYKIEGISDFAIGSPSVEMYAKSYNVWKQNDTAIRCTVNNRGYYYVTSYGVNVEAGPNNIYVNLGGNWNLSSPSAETINGYNPQIVWVQKTTTGSYILGAPDTTGKKAPVFPLVCIS